MSERPTAKLTSMMFGSGYDWEDSLSKSIMVRKEDEEPTLYTIAIKYRPKMRSDKYESRPG